MAVRIETGTILLVLALAGCAGEQLSPGSSAPPPIDETMTGRWTLSAPNAPSCGLEFNGAAAARAGTVTADGGCPGNFYTSRRWVLDNGVLTITSADNQLLAQLKPTATAFEGQSAAGTAVTLSR